MQDLAEVGKLKSQSDEPQWSQNIAISHLGLTLLRMRSLLGEENPAPIT